VFIRFDQPGGKKATKPFKFTLNGRTAFVRPVAIRGKIVRGPNKKKRNKKPGTCCTIRRYHAKQIYVERIAA
jgi:hypothetical protein